MVPRLVTRPDDPSLPGTVSNGTIGPFRSATQSHLTQRQGEERRHSRRPVRWWPAAGQCWYSGSSPADWQQWWPVERETADHEGKNRSSSIINHRHKTHGDGRKEQILYVLCIRSPNNPHLTTLQTQQPAPRPSRANKSLSAVFR